MLATLVFATALASTAVDASPDPDVDRALQACGVRRGGYTLVSDADETVAIVHSPSADLSRQTIKCLVKTARKKYQFYRFDSPDAQKRFDYAEAEFDSRPERGETRDQVLARVEQRRTLLAIKWSGANLADKARQVEAVAGFQPGQALSVEDGTIWVRLDRIPKQITYRRFMDLMSLVHEAMPTAKMRWTAPPLLPSLNVPPAP